jgi:hypothetical protein
MLLLARLNPLVVEQANFVELDLFIVIPCFEFVAISLLVVESLPMIHSNNLFLSFAQLRKLFQKLRSRFLYKDLESRNSLEVNSLLEGALFSQLGELFTYQLSLKFNSLNLPLVLSIKIVSLMVIKCLCLC